MNQIYLKPSIKLEPFIWDWYAWPYLIPPITAGFNILERHLSIMESYVQNPSIHCQAIKNPQLLGGPFIDLDGENINEVKNLISETKQTCVNLMSLSNAYKELDNMLQREAIGDSLEKFYELIPNQLKGLVELVYDLNHHPSIRIIEPFVYNKYYSSENQKIILSNTLNDHRKFLLSTPHINKENEVCLNIPFSDTRLDTLSKSRFDSENLQKIKHLFNVPESNLDLFLSFFTHSKPILPMDRNYTGEGVRIRYFGHACILVQTKFSSVLFDPVISYSIDINENESQKQTRYTLFDLPDYIDYVVITHNHQDHILFETLIQIRHKIKNLVFPANIIGSLQDPSLKLIFSKIGFSSLIELKELESVTLPDMEIIALPFLGEHADLNIQSKMAYSIKTKNKHLLFAADSNNLDRYLYDQISIYIGKVDILFLGMECDGAPLTWLYGPLLTSPIKRSYDNNRTLSGSSFERAWSIIQKLSCKEVCIYAMGQEPWLKYIMALEYTSDSIQMLESDKLINICRSNGIRAERPLGKKEWIIL